MNDTPLRRLDSGRWACYAPSFGPNPVMRGFCLSPEQTDILGLTWEEVLQQPWRAGLDESAWRRDRQLRAEHFDRFHRTGHDTPEGAMECYQEYLRVFETSELMGILTGGWGQV